jgi:uncharacterized protein (TIGR02452 family)
MRAKIRNVLRKCSLEEHNEIVLGAWGCDGRRLVEKMQAADMFHEALLGSNDAAPVAHSFKRVTFAISKTSSLGLGVFEIFQNRFQDFQ